MAERILESLGVVDALERYDGALRGFFGRRVPAADVEDLLQECYLRISRSLPELQDPDKLAAWVFRIARNLAVDHVRSAKRVSPWPRDVPIEGVPDRVPDPPDVAAEVGPWLAAQVDELPDKYAEALRESELNGRPHREIAEQLGLSISGVKSRVQRGRALLRDKLLACCRLQFDRRGHLLGVERRTVETAAGCCEPAACC